MDFSLTTVFVVPTSQTDLPTGSPTQDLTAGQLGIYDSTYQGTSSPETGPYFYIAQGRTNTYLQGTKRSDKIAGCNQTVACQPNVTEWYKVTGCPTPITQITDVTDFVAHCGDTLTLTLRAFSSYINTLYFNGFTRSVTVQAPCCDCGADPCDTVDVSALIDQFIEKLEATAPGTNPDNISFNTFWTFENVGGTILRISAKPLDVYGNPCDVSAFPYEYDRMRFNTFVYSGPATTADFIVADNCNIVAEATVTQNSNYAKGTSAEIAQLEKNFYSYQAGYLKHLYKMAGYNQNFETWVVDGTTYDTYYIKFNTYDRSANNWGAFLKEDSTVVIAVESGSAFGTALENALEGALGNVVDDSGVCLTTTSTTTVAPTTTTTTTGA